ncbi:MAG: gp436 family protein [Hyphomonas sp.]
MSYATLSDLTERAGDAELRQIADRDRDGTPDPEVIAAALEDADNTVNGYIGARYRLPLVSVPALVVTWSVSIARYVLHRNGAPEWVAQDYKDAIAALKDVARGLVSLPVAEGETGPAAQTGVIMAEHPPQVFTPQKMRGW